MKRIEPLLLLAAAASASCSGSGAGPAGPVDINGVADIQELDRLSLFTFCMFSDNKGDGPESEKNVFILPMIHGTQDMGAKFVLGLGDHLRSYSGQEQDWLRFVKEDQWWHANFYPAIGDGENAYYGSGQGDWGAGAGLVDDLELCDRDGVTCLDNHAEYHAVLHAAGLDVHFITAHYSDSGEVRFREESKQYLVDEVASIHRTGREIVIIAAHNADWLRKMTEEQKQALLDGADLLLGASSHVFTRYEYPDDKALFINTGSTGYAALWNNYVQVNVIDDPLRLVIQNMEAVEGGRKLQAGIYCWIKEVGGLISECGFENGTKWGRAELH